MARTPPSPAAPRRRGRPPKFGQPGEVVAVTLPEEVIRGLRRINPDLGWAIVALYEMQNPDRSVVPQARPGAELVAVGPRRRLIVVRRSLIGALPGVSVVPFDRDRAFLALEPGHGMVDLELAVIDRLDSDVIEERERRGLKELRQLLRKWRRDPDLRFETRAIIVGETVPHPNFRDEVAPRPPR
jgi:hypothetical protein